MICAASDVTFSLDTETGFRDTVFITGAYGLGETVVQGTVDPDEFYVFKPTFRAGHRTVLRRRKGGKEIRMVYAQAAGRERTRIVPTAAEDQRRFCISDAEALVLADAAIQIEDHYSRKAGRPTPSLGNNPVCNAMSGLPRLTITCVRGRCSVETSVRVTVTGTVPA